MMTRLRVFTAFALLLVACGAPTAPDRRQSEPQVNIVCSGLTATEMTCRAPISCMYSCPAGTPSDVTQLADWTIDNTAVATVVSPGAITAVRVGHTVLRVAWKYSEFATTRTFIPIAVFPGTAPLPTYEYEGNIFDGGGPPRTPLNGAAVEILTGPAAGRQTISGTPPDFLPGATIPPSWVSGHYAFFGVPEGTYRLRVSKTGFVPQEVEMRQFTDVVLVPQQ